MNSRLTPAIKPHSIDTVELFKEITCGRSVVIEQLNSDKVLVCDAILKDSRILKHNPRYLNATLAQAYTMALRFACSTDRLVSVFRGEDRQTVYVIFQGAGGAA